tara:strand:+ start:1656 stop:1889 length:234 start_codon:yes stop_codon:yes gene_type:complete
VNGKQAKRLRREARRRAALATDTQLKVDDEFHAVVTGIRRGNGADGVQRVQAFYGPDSERAIYQDMKKERKKHSKEA